jgi:hypothetical protein
MLFTVGFGVIWSPTCLVPLLAIKIDGICVYFRHDVCAIMVKIVLNLIVIMKIKAGFIFFTGVEMIAAQCNSIIYRFIIIHDNKSLYSAFMSKTCQIVLILFDFSLAFGLSYSFYNSTRTIEVCCIEYAINNHISGS